MQAPVQVGRKSITLGMECGEHAFITLLREAPAGVSNRTARNPLYTHILSFPLRDKRSASGGEKEMARITKEQIEEARYANLYQFLLDNYGILCIGDRH